MAILCRQTLQEFIAGKKLVTDFIDLKGQLQQSGFDLTLEKVYSFEGKGTIDFDNSERAFPGFVELSFEKDFVELKQGCYKIRFNEKLNLPSNLCAIGLPRSSLLRMGATIESALWDPGFEGKGESLLFVHNPFGLKLKKNAKLMQLAFIGLDKSSDSLYNGIHKNIKH